MYQKEFDIQRLTDTLIEFTFGEFSRSRKFIIGGFKVHLLMYPKRARHSNVNA